MSTEKPIVEKGATPAPAPKYKYVGPAYKQGLMLPNGIRIRPLEMTDLEIEDHIQRFPALKEYFSV